MISFRYDRRRNSILCSYGVTGTERFELSEENKLSYKGTVESGTVLLNSKGKIMICINDSGNAAYKNYNDTSVVVVSGKTCTVNAGETQVLLDGDNTIDEYTNQELTSIVEELQKKIETLEEKLDTKADKTSVSNLQNEISILTSKVNNLQNSMLDIDTIYPVGSIYISVDDTDPSELFGGTWETYGEGKTLVGVDSSNTNYNSVNKTGGSSTVTLSISNIPSHTHSIPSLSGTTNTTGNHNHTGLYESSIGFEFKSADGRVVASTTSGYRYGITSNGDTSLYVGYSGNHSHTLTTVASTTGATGSGSSFSVQNPYITVYMWKRIK